MHISTLLAVPPLSIVPAVLALLISCGLPASSDAQILSQLIKCDSKSDCGDCAGCQAFFQGAKGLQLGAGLRHGKSGRMSRGLFDSRDAAAEEEAADTPLAPIEDLALLPRGFGADASAFSAAPSMIGDFFGNGLGITAAGLDYYYYPGSQNSVGNQNSYYDNEPGATIAVAGGDRRFKISDNSSPFPRNRIFFNYHHFHNALTDVNLTNQNLDRYTFGLERTFLDELASVELRIPFAGGLASVQDTNSTNTTNTTFGNMSLTVKGLLAANDTSALSLGLSMGFPTGSNALIKANDENKIEFINDSFYLQPFLGYFRQTDERVFHQAFLQFDFDTSGSELRHYYNDGTDYDASQVYSQTLMYVDYQLGWWCYQANRDKGIQKSNPFQQIQAIAPIIELHYTTTLEDLDSGEQGTSTIVQNARRDILNLTGGLFFQLSDTGSLKLSAAAPLRSGLDKLFDAEFGVQYERRY